jgi:F-type H+-transporting ATPase subunit gamma
MANLKETRVRIKSIKFTEKITKAMKMVATAKLKKIRDSLDSLKEYKKELNIMISSIISRLSETELKKFHSNPLISNSNSNSNIANLIIFNTSNKGLCGGINNYNIKKLNTKVEELKNRNHNIIIYCIGKKGFDYCSSHYPQYLFNKKPTIIDEKTNFNLDMVKDEIMNIILTNKIYSSSIIFSNFINTNTQKTTEVELTPIHSIKSSKLNSDKYQLDSNAGDILTKLLPEFMLCSILFTVFENATSEQSARMIAMDNATNNAKKAIQSLTLIYNRIRQANITREISEIVAGVESLKQS